MITSISAVIIFLAMDKITLDALKQRTIIVGNSGACGLSKLNPRGFIGGFDRLGIACVHGDAPNPHRAVVGNDRAAPSNRGATAQRNSSPVLQSFGSTALDLAVALVARLARQFSDRTARDGLALAP